MDDDSSLTSPSADAELTILNRFLEELRAAIGAEKSAVINRYCLLHPDLAGRFRKIAAGTVNVDSLLAATGPLPVACGFSTGAGANSLPLCFGPYRVLRMIGRGGMGEVYEAEEAKLERHVAVKTVRRSRSTEPAILERFDRERRVLARMHHTHIVPILATGQEGDLLYFGMPYIPGVSLNQVIRTAARHSNVRSSSTHLSSFEALIDLARSETSEEPRAEEHRRPASVETDPVPPVPEPAGHPDWLMLPMPYFRAVATTMAQVAEAVHYAHQDGIIHRDLKPSNIMVERSGHPWVLDFGLARLKSGQAQMSTALAASNGHVSAVGNSQVEATPHPDHPHHPFPSLTVGPVGTIPYMPPERLAAEPNGSKLEALAVDEIGEDDPRSDIWSLGATLG